MPVADAWSEVWKGHASRTCTSDRGATTLTGFSIQLCRFKILINSVPPVGSSEQIETAEE
jgi:hypothetical protein